MKDCLNYIKYVKKNPKKVGEFIKLAVKRFEEDTKRTDIYFCQVTADRAITFAERFLYLWEGSWRGEPVRLVDWQIFIIKNIFGWKYKESGIRRYRSIYIQVARKNAKTTIAAIISIIHVFIDNDPTPQILVGANNEDQAKICTTSIGKILEISPEFRELINKSNLKIYKYRDKVTSVTLKWNGRDASIQAMSRDPETKDGFNPSAGIIDEYHEAKDDKLLNVIESGQVVRKEPILLIITTAGFNKQSPCYSKLRKSAVAILRGQKQDDRTFAMIYEPDEGDDWQNVNTWHKANPMLAHIDHIKTYLQSAMVKAINEGGTKIVNFQTKNLDMWVDSSESWIEPSKFDALSGELDFEYLKNYKCYAGVDLAWTRDLNALSLIWFDGQKYYLKTHYFMPDEVVNERSEKDHVDYQKWANEGWLTLMHGSRRNDEYLSSFLINTANKFNVVSWVFDANRKGELIDLLEADGQEVYAFSQAARNFTIPTDKTETVINTGMIVHDGNPITSWMLGNARLKTFDGNYRKIVKENESAKIDGVITMIMAIGHVDNEEDTSSKYNDGEMIIL